MPDRNGTIVLTGATSGIGLATAHELVPSVTTLVLHGPQSPRDVDRRLASVRDAAGPDTTVHYLQADFTKPEAVQDLAADILDLVPDIHVLVNNAGIPGNARRRLTESGVELTFEVNFLAGVLLTNLLLPHVDGAGTGRIVNVASETHFSGSLDLDDLAFDHRAYSGPEAYAQSKLAIVTYSCWLAGQIPQKVVSVHPGVIGTELLHTMFAIPGADPREGGANLAAAIRADVESGSYLAEGTPAPPNPVAADTALQRRLHDAAANLLGMDIA